MDEMEEQLGSILSNPDAMQKIMALAQSLNQAEGAHGPEKPASPAPQPAPVPPARPSAPPQPPLDLSALQKLRGGIDKNQRTLLNALAPYLSRQRITKLEKAMQAAKMAQIASSMLSGPQSNPGR